MKNKQTLKIAVILLLIFATVTFVYRKHFRSEFHFDDSHTIVDNMYIRDLGNFKKFFTDASTFSSLPQNQSYRPMFTLSCALDYYLKKTKSPDGTPDPLFFHISNFFWFLLQLLLMYLLIIKIFQVTHNHKWNVYLALFAVAWYGLHPVTAETINYIAARSDSYSTLAVLLSFVIYIYSAAGRKYFLYLIPFILGILVKPPAIMFAPMLLVYIIYFEKGISLDKLFAAANRKKLVEAIVSSMPVFIIGLVMYFIQAKLTPASFTPGIISRSSYIITQPFVFVYYFGSLFFPTHLSADTDWTPLANIWNLKFFIGSAFIIGLLILAFVTGKKKSLLPISFGIIWFFLALLPSSSIVAFSEVMNDHRMFFPFIGLIISVCWGIGLLIQKYENIILKENALLYILFAAFLVLIVYGWGTTQRVKVWSTDESLWLDVTEKSPANGRGLMNYGLTQMRIGKYDVALDYFERALKYTPYYATLYINLGVVKGAMGKIPEAEESFKKALMYGPDNYSTYYYYARFLNEHNRNAEAIPLAVQAVKLSPGYITARYLLMSIYSYEYQWDNLKGIAEETLQIFPNDPQTLNYLKMSGNRKSRVQEAEDLAKSNRSAPNYLNLSLRYYQERQYLNCVKACNEALKIKPDYPDAYNNMCSAYNMLGEWDKAIEAGQKAVKLNPSSQLAKNNLNKSIELKGKEAGFLQKKTPESLLDLSMLFYTEGLYEKCIQACNEAIRQKPDYPQAYNNLCSAYNSIGKFREGAAACEKAIQLKPDFQLAKNNLKWAKDNIR